MAKYDFMVAGKWRNHREVKKVLEVVRAANKTAYCFIENHYKGEKVEFSFDGDIDAIMRQLEGLKMDDPLIKKIFDTDMVAEVESDNFLLVLPAGISGHVEAGVAYGLGKKCYAVGIPEKTETLYRVFDQVFPDIKALENWLTTS